jgi:predicted membrane-bound spermidine synthase
MRYVNSLKPYLIVFVVSGCVLITEIVAGRILAPFIGVSVYTWTSIIGIVLAGISVGNYLGGRVADRFPSQFTLGIILLLGGLSTLAVLPLINLVAGAVDGMPIIARIVLLTGLLFLPPSLILSMTTLVVIRLHIKDVARAGNVVGKLYAVSTAGSILGTFLTGFLLIQWMGTRPILLTVSIVLVVLALATGNLWRIRSRRVGMAGLMLLAGFVGVLSLGFASKSLETGCLRESNCFCIKIKEDEIDGHPIRILILDQLLHSHVALDDPQFLVYGYEKVMADLATHLARREPDMRTLFIGGGGYTLPRFIEEAYPLSTVEVIEIDPQVTEVAFDYLGLRRDTRVLSYNKDARMAVPELKGGTYDLVVTDAFNDVSVPYHLTTREFNEQVSALLTPDGMYMANVVDKLHSGRFLRAYVNTLRQTFPYVYLLTDDDSWDFDERYAYVVVGVRQPLSITDVRLSNVAEGRGAGTTDFMPFGDFLNWLVEEETVVLTDGFAPVDNMLAPLYLESR